MDLSSEGRRHHFDDTIGVGESLSGISSEDSINLLVRLQQSLICPICQDIMFAPSVTACGHTFCYNCLYEWLKGRDRKTCPNCRTMLKQRPCLSVGLREVADVLTQTVAARDETKAQHFRETRLQALKDYEDDIKYHGKPFPIAFENESTMMDREDGVDRCPHCHWEVNSDVCENCGRHVDLGATAYEAESYFVDDDEDDEDYGVEADEYEEDGFVVGDDDEGSPFSHAADISFDPDVRFVEAEISEGDDDDDEYYSGEQTYDEMADDSMLQDDEDIEITSAPPQQQQHRRRPPQRIVLSDSEDEGLIPRRRTSSHVSLSDDGAGPNQEITHIEDDDDDDDAMLLTALHSHRRPTKRRAQRVRDSDEDQDNDTSSTD